jgi:hypothetical protein
LLGCRCASNISERHMLRPGGPEPEPNRPLWR